MPLLGSGLEGVHQKVNILLLVLFELLGATVLLGIRVSSRPERP